MSSKQVPRERLNVAGDHRKASLPVGSCRRIVVVELKEKGVAEEEEERTVGLGIVAVVGEEGAQTLSFEAFVPVPGVVLLSSWPSKRQMNSRTRR